MDRKITIVIDPLGRPTIEAQNFHGVGCQDATKALETALASGTGGVTRVIKPEWFESQDEGERVHETQQW